MLDFLILLLTLTAIGLVALALQKFVLAAGREAK